MYIIMDIPKEDGEQIFVEELDERRKRGKEKEFEM